jgi:hypothetical protein
VGAPSVVLPIVLPVVLPVVLVLPNIPPRRRAVQVHDLNHVLTGYGTDWTGELRISGHELGMGCGAS